MAQRPGGQDRVRVAAGRAVMRALAVAGLVLSILVLAGVLALWYRMVKSGRI